MHALFFKLTGSKHQSSFLRTYNQFHYATLIRIKHEFLKAVKHDSTAGALIKIITC